MAYKPNEIVKTNNLSMAVSSNPFLAILQKKKKKKNDVSLIASTIDAVYF